MRNLKDILFEKFQITKDSKIKRTQHSERYITIDLYDSTLYIDQPFELYIYSSGKHISPDDILTVNSIRHSELGKYRLFNNDNGICALIDDDEELYKIFSELTDDSGKTSMYIVRGDNKFFKKRCTVMLSKNTWFEHIKK